MDANQRHYLLRRLHSLTGVIPVGVFLLQHIYANTLAAWGPLEYQHHTNFILDQPLLPLMEWGVVFLPLLFHSLLGFYYMVPSKSRPNVSVYKYQKNWMYMLQRLTGVLVFFFVIFHVWTTRFMFTEDDKRMVYEAMTNYFTVDFPWAFWVYCIGNVAAAFHFCNGFWGFSIMWGITVTRKSQNRMFKAMMGLFVLLSVGGIIGAGALAKKWSFLDDDAIKLQNQTVMEEWNEKKAEKGAAAPAGGAGKTGEGK